MFKEGSILALTTLAVVFPSAVVRLCQFHVVQAILRWDCDDGRVTAKAPRISSEVKYRILRSFRGMQRCRTWEDWPAAMALFLQQTHTIIFSQGDISLEEELCYSSNPEGDATGDDMRHLPSQAPKVQVKKPQRPRGYRSYAEMTTEWEFVQHYFSSNWFTRQWIRMWLLFLHEWLMYFITALFTDIGLPPGQTRDGTWNVNNWTERAFLVFDTIFLDNRHNKRYVACHG